ncbi:MAG TPA: MBL fold metallo-hydrolase [Puia sp.]|nr:MBL fold metallo-hydrolase [Puia sp.]
MLKGASFMPDKIEALLLTHDHYDHLDYPSIRKLKHRVTPRVGETVNINGRYPDEPWYDFS